MKMIKFVGFIIGIMLTAIGFYLGGYDFNERGYVALNLYFAALILGVLGAILFSTFEE